MCKTGRTRGLYTGEMLKFDASFLYVLRVVIIDFGPDDVLLKQNDGVLLEGWMVRAMSMEKSEMK